MKKFIAPFVVAAALLASCGNQPSSSESSVAPSSSASSLISSETSVSSEPEEIWTPLDLKKEADVTKIGQKIVATANNTLGDMSKLGIDFNLDAFIYQAYYRGWEMQSPHASNTWMEYTENLNVANFAGVKVDLGASVDIDGLVAGPTDPLKAQAHGDAAISIEDASLESTNKGEPVVTNINKIINGLSGKEFEASADAYLYKNGTYADVTGIRDGFDTVIPLVLSEGFPTDPTEKKQALDELWEGIFGTGKMKIEDLEAFEIPSIPTALDQETISMILDSVATYAPMLDGYGVFAMNENNDLRFTLSLDQDNILDCISTVAGRILGEEVSKEDLESIIEGSGFSYEGLGVDLCIEIRDDYLTACTLGLSFNQLKYDDEVLEVYDDFTFQSVTAVRTSFDLELGLGFRYGDDVEVEIPEDIETWPVAERGEK